MKLRIFGDVDAYLDRVSATLMAREAATSLLLGVALRLREGVTATGTKRLFSRAPRIRVGSA